MFLQVFFHPKSQEGLEQFQKAVSDFKAAVAAAGGEQSYTENDGTPVDIIWTNEDIRDYLIDVLEVPDELITDELCSGVLAAISRNLQDRSVERGNEVIETLVTMEMLHEYKLL